MIGTTGERDLLTGLLTKEAFIRQVSDGLQAGELAAEGLACVYFDVKAFKLFYTRNGFDMGFACLISIGALIREEFDGEPLCRSSNDHFILLAGREGLSERIAALQEKVHTQWKHTGLELVAGIYSLEDGNVDMMEVCSNAKVACKSAEKAGGSLTVYDGELERSIRLKQHIIHHFDEALEKRYIELYYQPIMHMITKRLCGYEILARWQDPAYGLLLPDDFLPILTEAKQVHRLDIYMVEHACENMRRLLDEGQVVVPISLNLSQTDFEQTDMFAVVEKALKDNRLSKEYLHFELAEDMLKNDREDMQRELKRFRDAGYLLGVDNFGGEYSSLHILKDMQVDTLKIDGEFLTGARDGIRARVILKNILNMAKELGIQTMINGLEDEADIAFIQQIGCEKTQGDAFGEPEPFDLALHERLRPENDLERDYCDAIGRVNILSQTPMKTGWSYQEDDASIANLLPLAITEFDGSKFHFLLANDNFRGIFNAFATSETDDVESVFNNSRLTIATQLKGLAEQCVYTGTEYAQDFAAGDGYYRIMLRCISYNVEEDTSAILAVAEKISKDDPAERSEKMDVALRFLYSMYARIDIVNADGSNFDNIYLDSSKYNAPVIRGELREILPKFAERNIYSEDRQKFLEFLDLSTMEDRLAEVDGRYIVDYLRTRDAKGYYDWMMYMVIPVIYEGKAMYMICSRGIDGEKMRRLPEISQTGAVYYDMPGNPIYLLLASSAFTNMLDYGSFDTFLRNSFFVEAELTDNIVLNLHLGKQEIMGGSDLGNMGIPYDEVIREMITGSVVEKDKAGVESFYDRQRLLEAYARGEINGNVEYLRLPDQGRDSQPRYMNTCYQMRGSEDGKIHVYILTFDVDDYRRTNETIHRLAERDTLTGLYNRSTSGALIDKMLHSEETKTASLVILDLDNFKQINDRYGHDCGDSILRDASSRMRDLFESHGIVARIGGDEFLAVIRNMAPKDVDRVLAAFTAEKKTVDYHGRGITYTMSIGYAQFPKHGREYNELYQNADMALYTVKMHGRNSFRQYNPEMAGVNRTHLGFNIKNISDGMPGGFLVYRNTEEMEILFANRHLMSIYGCDNMEEFRELTGNSFRGCVYEEDWEFVSKTISSQVSGNAGYDYVQYRAKTADGKIKVIEDYGRLYHSEDDGDLFYVFMLDLADKEKNYGHILEKDFIGMLKES